MPEWLNAMGPSAFWLAALIIFAVAEALTVGLTSIWFALGALCALVTSVFTDSLAIQIGVFLVVALVTVILLRPFARKHMNTHKVPTNADRIIGAEAVVTEEINNLKGQGLVSVAGTQWTARADGEEVIPKGATVRVLRIEGVKVMVTPISCASEHKE